MLIRALVILGILCYFGDGATTENKTATTIEQVFVVYRHGARLMVNKDDIANVDLVPLTNEGKTQGYELGQWLRLHYPDLLHRKYKSDEIYVRSSDVDRCIMTSQALLAGLYHPIDPTDRWNEESDLQWTPVPIHTVPKNLDDMLYLGYVDPKCTEVKTLLKSIISSWRQKYPDILNHFENSSKSELDTKHEIHICINEYDKTNMPSTITDEQVESFIKEARKGYFGNEKLKGLNTGAFLRDILNYVETNKKALLYSTHDSFFWAIFYTLELENPAKINFISTLLFEIHVEEPTAGQTPKKYIKIIHKNGPGAPLEVKHIPNCDELCPLEKFKTFVEPIAFSDWPKDCK